MDLIVSGSDEAILMVECGADGVTEAEVLDALDIAHGEIKTLIGAMEELRETAGKEKVEVAEPTIDEGLLEQISSKYGSRLDEATQIPEKLARQDAIDEVEREALAELAAGEGDVEVDPEKARRSPARSRSSRRTSSGVGSPSTRSALTGAPRTRSGRSSARSTCCRGSTARRCSRAARRRSSPRWRSAPRAWT